MYYRKSILHRGLKVETCFTHRNYSRRIIKYYLKKTLIIQMKIKIPSGQTKGQSALFQLQTHTHTHIDTRHMHPWSVHLWSIPDRFCNGGVVKKKLRELLAVSGLRLRPQGNMFTSISVGLGCIRNTCTRSPTLTFRRYKNTRGSPFQHWLSQRLYNIL